MSSTHLFPPVLKNSVENYQFKKSIFQGQQKKSQEQKMRAKLKSTKKFKKLYFQN